jgi:hypothetical protein
MEFEYFEEGEVVYSIGDEPDTFYILLQGKMNMETIVKLSNKIRYPVGQK